MLGCFTQSMWIFLFCLYHYFTSWHIWLWIIRNITGQKKLGMVSERQVSQFRSLMISKSQDKYSIFHYQVNRNLIMCLNIVSQQIPQRIWIDKLCSKCKLNYITGPVTQLIPKLYANLSFKNLHDHSDENNIFIQS